VYQLYLKYMYLLLCMHKYLSPIEWSCLCSLSCSFRWQHLCALYEDVPNHVSVYVHTVKVRVQRFCIEHKYPWYTTLTKSKYMHTYLCHIYTMSNLHTFSHWILPLSVLSVCHSSVSVTCMRHHTTDVCR